MEEKSPKTNMISTTELSENMTVANDVIVQQGHKLIAEGYVVKDPEKVRNLLEKFQVEFIEIIVDDDKSIENQSSEGSILNSNKNVQTQNVQTSSNADIAMIKRRYRKSKERLSTQFEDILLNKPIDREQIQSQLEKDLEIFNLGTNVFQVIEFIRKMDDTMYTHCYNVALTSFALGRWLGLHRKALEELFLTALLTDVGNLKIPTELLHKKENLTAKEIEELNKHPLYSCSLITNYSFVTDEMKRSVLMHHERMDGSGYPFKAQGEDIPLYARIIAVADTYNIIAANTHPIQAINIMELEYKGILDVKILYTFLTNIINCFTGQKIRLNDERTAEIIFMDKTNIFKPIVRILDTDEILNLDQVIPGVYIKEFVS